MHGEFFYLCGMQCIYTAGGMTSSDVIKEDGALYGSPGAGLVAIGDQGLQEEGGNMTGTSSWGQFPNGGCGFLCMYAS